MEHKNYHFKANPSEFNPQIWLTKFKAASSNRSGFQELRKEIFFDTVKVALDGKYYVDNQEVQIECDNITNKSQFYVKPPKIANNTQSNKTIYHVIEADCLETAALINKIGFNVCVLNMANRQNPGGGVFYGAGAQEENIFRRSNIFQSLYQYADYAHLYNLQQNPYFSYPLDRNTGGVYSKDVTIFRGTEMQGYPFLHVPYKISVVSVAAINKPSLLQSGHKFYLTGDLIEPAKNKIRTILRIAAINNHDSLILGALGCGAFQNPPNHIAEIFSEVFDEEEFKNLFKMIVFAIIEDHNSNHSHNPQGNLLPFKEIFDNK